MAHNKDEGKVKNGEKVFYDGKEVAVVNGLKWQKIRMHILDVWVAILIKR